jgi:hypothetical protein
MRIRATSHARAGDAQGRAPPYIVRCSIAGPAIMHDRPARLSAQKQTKHESQSSEIS